MSASKRPRATVDPDASVADGSNAAATLGNGAQGERGVRPTAVSATRRRPPASAAASVRGRRSSSTIPGPGEKGARMPQPRPSTGSSSTTVNRNGAVTTQSNGETRASVPVTTQPLRPPAGNGTPAVASTQVAGKGRPQRPAPSGRIASESRPKGRSWSSQTVTDQRAPAVTSPPDVASPAPTAHLAPPTALPEPAAPPTEPTAEPSPDKSDVVDDASPVAREHPVPAPMAVPSIIPATPETPARRAAPAPPAEPAAPGPVIIPAGTPAAVPERVERIERPSEPPPGSTMSTHTVAPVPRVVGRRPRVRKVTRVVRHVDPWTVFKVGAVFSLVVYLVALTSGVLLWNVAHATGTIDNLERFFESFGWSEFEFNGGEIFHNAWIGGLFAAVGLTGAAVLGATLFNLITDLVGGVRFTVLEEEVVERTSSPMRRFVVRRPAGDPSTTTDLDVVRPPARPPEWPVS
jgi:hypothetical protein